MQPQPTPGIPRWVKIMALVGVVVAVLLVVLMLGGGGGEHGPGRHGGSQALAAVA